MLNKSQGPFSKYMGSRTSSATWYIQNTQFWQFFKVFAVEGAPEKNPFDS